MIAGLQKMTLLDFPGKVACIVFLHGCNWRCPFCHNSELLAGKGEQLMDEETFFGMTMTTPWFYSALYNGAYMLPDLVILLVVYVLLCKTPLVRYLKGDDLR
jgi:hypothetical protein